ncbi:MAG TPA: XTP/dITP diphosphatase [Dissulfurispiraceae bacterium]|nr:XTP/dITP diphosphatase [Dissulfurispiraceae bacterium]
MEIVLATRNRRKAEELTRILEGFNVRFKTLDDCPSCPEVHEDQPTFEGNAIKKAKAVAHATGTPALADDSGLEVFALRGAPGVLSARYAGEGADDRGNVSKLLTEMQGIPVSQRGARFVCCLALAFPGGEVRVFRGTVEGSITTGPCGSFGFGYDPVFVPVGHDRTFAEMSASEKDTLSHRNAALRQCRDYLQQVSREGGVYKDF